MTNLLTLDANAYFSFFMFLGVILIFEISRGVLRRYGTTLLVIVGALLGSGGLRIFNPGVFGDVFLDWGSGLLWLGLGLETALLWPKKRKYSVLTFGSLGVVLTLGFSLIPIYLGIFSWAPLLALSLLALSRSLIPLQEQSNQALILNRGGLLASGAIGTLGFFVLGLVSLGSIHSAGVMGSYVVWGVGLGIIVATLVVYPWALRPLLRRFSEESPWMTFLLVFISLGFGLLGTLGSWPWALGIFLSAFTAGRLLLGNSVLKVRVEKSLVHLIFPSFLLLLGMKLQPQGLLTSWEPWVLGTSIALLGGISFFLASGFLKQVFSYSTNETVYAWSLTLYSGPLAFLVIFWVVNFYPAVGNSALVAIIMTNIFGPMIHDFLARDLIKKGALGSDPLEGKGRRIMVSLSNPDTAGHLVELALGLHSRDNTEPLYPVIVVQDGPESEKAVVQAERVLSSALAKAVALGTPVVPVTSLDLNITSGLARVARARRISLMILGWNGQYSVQRSIFGSVLDQTVKTSKLEIFVLKSSGTLLGTKRLLVGFPPMVETQPGFDQALSDLVLLGATLGVHYIFYGLTNTVNHIADRLRLWKTPGEKSFEVLNEWKNLLDRWSSRLNPEDMLVLFSLRQYQLAWQPSLDRWPRMVAKSFPSQPFLVIYPQEGPDTLGDTEEIISQNNVTGPWEDALKVLLHMNNRDLAQALRDLLQIDFYGETLEKTSILLHETAIAQPVELRPGVVLVHTHLNIVDDFSIYWGVNPEGWIIPDLGESVKILVVLISPLAEGPEKHLRKLAELARLIGKSDWTDDLLKAKTREELVAKSAKYRV